MEAVEKPKETERQEFTFSQVQLTSDDDISSFTRGNIVFESIVIRTDKGEEKLVPWTSNSGAIKLSTDADSAAIKMEGVRELYSELESAIRQSQVESRNDCVSGASEMSAGCGLPSPLQAPKSLKDLSQFRKVRLSQTNYCRDESRDESRDDDLVLLQLKDTITRLPPSIRRSLLDVTSALEKEHNALTEREKKLQVLQRS